MHTAPLPRPSQGAGWKGKPPQARVPPIYLHWLGVHPVRLNSYGRPLCKVPPVADFVRPCASRTETCDAMRTPKPPASLMPTTELGVWPGQGCAGSVRRGRNCVGFPAARPKARPARAAAPLSEGGQARGKAAAGMGFPWLPTVLRLSCPPRSRHQGRRAQAGRPSWRVKESERGWASTVKDFDKITAHSQQKKTNYFG